MKAERLAKNWSISVNSAKQTPKVVTQQGVRTAANPSLSRRFWFWTNNCQLRHRRLQCDMHADALLDAKTVTSMRGNKCAQIVATRFGWCRAFPLKELLRTGAQGGWPHLGAVRKPRVLMPPPRNKVCLCRFGCLDSCSEHVLLSTLHVLDPPFPSLLLARQEGQHQSRKGPECSWQNTTTSTHAHTLSLFPFLEQSTLLGLANKGPRMRQG
jgi:hypothetical protein